MAEFKRRCCKYMELRREELMNKTKLETSCLDLVILNKTDI